MGHLPKGRMSTGDRHGVTSNLLTYKDFRLGPLAQRLEQRTHNPLVEGSNPSGPTNFSIV